MTAIRPSFPNLRVGLAGFGTVGQALARLVSGSVPSAPVRQDIDLRITRIANRNVYRKRVEWLPGVEWHDDPLLLATADDVDVVVELMGGVDRAYEFVKLALSHGKHVVTANKALLAAHGDELQALAAARGASLRAEAAVAGGIPLLRVLRESFVSHRLSSVSGILNGTSNFILTEMERAGRTYGEALADAQRLGYAEADPSADVGGLDAACKLAIIARLAFGQKITLQDIKTDGISQLRPWDFIYGRKLGRTPRQLGLVRKIPGDGIFLSVRTHMVPTESLFASVAGPYNAVLVQSEDGGDFFFAGAGAGGTATATAVFSDLLELARSGQRPETPFFGAYEAAPLQKATTKDFIAPFYLRFVVRDRPGILADIARCLSDHHINIDAVLQLPDQHKEAFPFVITIEAVAESQVEDAIRQILAMDFNVEPPLCSPMTP